MDRRQLKRNALRFSIESALIVFSVLLAFFLDDYKDELKKAERARTAVANIVAELESNKRSVEKVIEYHRKVYERLSAFSVETTKPDSSLFDVLASSAPEGLLPPALQTTAWDTAQASGVLQDLKYEKSYVLSLAYRLQVQGVDSTWKGIRASLDSRAFKPGVEKADVRYLEFSFGELLAQEQYLVSVYDETLKKL